MGNTRRITLIDGYREVGEVDLICAFTIPDYSEKYIIYTKNEKDKGGNPIIYSGKIVTMDNNQFLENIDEGKEWNKLKEIMRAMAKHSLEGEKYV